jgi:hypothetical protein
VLFAAAKRVSHEIFAQVVGRRCALDHTRPVFGPAIRVALDIPLGAKSISKLEAAVLMAIAMFQPVTRGELTRRSGGRSRAS